MYILMLISITGNVCSYSLILWNSIFFVIAFLFQNIFDQVLFQVKNISESQKKQKFPSNISTKGLFINTDFKTFNEQ